MITPVRINGLIMWDYTSRAHLHELFLCLGDHGLFCMIKFEEI